MKFEDAVEVILEIEGGFVNDPRDPGMGTNFGISKHAYPDLDIKRLTRDDAVTIYRRDYWDALHCDSLPELIRLPLFDCAVNQGLGFAVGTLQRALLITADGVIGPVTVAALVACPDIERLRENFMARRLKAYTSSSRWSYFGAGWAGRLLEVALK